MWIIDEVISLDRIDNWIRDQRCLSSHSEFVRNKIYKYGVGGVAKAGIYFEAFTDYLYQMIHFEKRAQIGGFKVGGGIGLHF